jgi:hypothetical protein
MSASANNGASVLSWPGQLLSEEDLRRHWTNQVEIVLGAKTIVTPLAWDWLRSQKIQVRRDERPVPAATENAGWAYAEETKSALVDAAVKALRQEGRMLRAMERGTTPLAMWFKTLAVAVACGDPSGVLLFCREPGLAACVANKVDGVRAASVSQASQLASLQKALGPNLLAATIEGRTFFEIRQLLRQATAVEPTCPNDFAELIGGVRCVSRK